MTISSVVTKYVEPPEAGRKMCSNGSVHISTWPLCPFTCMIKIFNNLLLQNQSDGLETWYVASGIGVSCSQMLLPVICYQNRPLPCEIFPKNDIMHTSC